MFSNFEWYVDDYRKHREREKAQYEFLQELPDRIRTGLDATLDNRSKLLQPYYDYEPTRQVLEQLDDMGVIRNIAYMTGMYIGNEVLDPWLAQQYTAGNIGWNEMQAGRWGSRWLTGVPLYEEARSNIRSRSSSQIWDDFLVLQDRAQRAGLIQGRWKLKLTHR